MRGDPILYVRRGCPWCREAKNFFATHGASLEIRDVTQNYAHLKRLVEASGQSQTPTFIVGDFIISDFSVDELIEELRERPDIQAALGITDREYSG